MICIQCNGTLSLLEREETLLDSGAIEIKKKYKCRQCKKVYKVRQKVRPVPEVAGVSCQVRQENGVSEVNRG